MLVQNFHNLIPITQPKNNFVFILPVKIFCNIFITVSHQTSIGKSLNYPTINEGKNTVGIIIERVNASTKLPYHVTHILSLNRSCIKHDMSFNT